MVMTSQPPAPRGRAVVPLIVVTLVVALGAGCAALHPRKGSGASGKGRLPGQSRAAGAAAARTRGDAGIYSLLRPSVVDVTATLGYDGETAAGTGFVVDARAGLVLTNNHVIRDATTVTARLTSTGRTYPARIVGTDPDADIAVLQLSGATGLTPAPVGDSAAVTVGTPVLAIGNRAGQGGAPATAPGVINGLNQTIRAADGISGFTETLHGMLQTSARIQPGDSGGPLAGPTGTVIGVDTAAGTGTSPTGYAIPIGAAMALERQIATGRRAPGISIGTAGFLGVVVTSAATAAPVPRPRAPQARDLDAAGAAPRPAGCLGTRAGAKAPAAVAPANPGAVVDGVLCGTGASEVGIAPGDVITRVAGHPVSSASALSAAMSGCRPGAVVPVTWTTVAGVTRTSLVRLGAAPAP